MKIKLLPLLFLLLHNPIVTAEEMLPIIPAAPSVGASSYLLMDFNSGKLLVEHNVNQKLPPASLTKIMTAYVVAEELRHGRVTMQDEVLISKKAWQAGGSKMFIEVDKKVAFSELPYGMVIQSGNDASIALAEHISGMEETFADLMNKHAERLGMKNTHFINSTGLPHEQHYTTAADLAILAHALIKNHPDIYALHKIKEFEFNKIKQRNRNQLLWRDNSVDGIKTGHTEAAGYCLVASAIRDDMRLISIVMNASNMDARVRASQALLNYGYRFYETSKFYSAHEPITQVKIWKADRDMMALGLRQDIYVTIPRGQFDRTQVSVEVNKDMIAPISKDTQQGVLSISYAGEKLATVPLFPLEDIHQGGFMKRFKDNIHLLWE